MELEIAPLLETLGNPNRLAVFRLLMRRYPQAVPAGEIARALELKPSTLSVYLGALRQAGLIEQRREGTSLLYRPDMTRSAAMIQALWGDCCRGRPDLCPPPLLQHGDKTMTPARPYNVLFICTGNSARSIFAEALLRDLGGEKFVAHSAGTQPYSELNPVAVQMLAEKGHDTALLRSKNVTEFQGESAPPLDFVFTVCDRAANETCPPWPGQPISGHWGLPDPVKVEGTQAEKRLAFQQAYGLLKNRIQAFTALPFEGLDRISLQARIDDIALDGTPA
ncbi:helix-turn-helix domain-containing protein [Poseidonocella sedimentorum]|uniref:Protein-tyrosine-phosphatase n=1 Tax=Poseidonocella sedimentorum TaxID=871652 RepID=A0A1I6CU82_9RHOB|nr:helix-turn-helix domain-containing protein [Poseidonocella sedimentorum]SFQ96667.1 Protein-tyrosine-phosphatase [Poseidonocella sedimentorum]